MCRLLKCRLIMFSINRPNKRECVKKHLTHSAQPLTAEFAGTLLKNPPNTHLIGCHLHLAGIMTRLQDTRCADAPA